jgi:hypothetical protein
MSTFKDLAEGKSVNVVEATVIKTLDGGKAVIAESRKSLALLLTEDDDKTKKLLIATKGIKLIKPEMIQKSPLVIASNEKFKLIPGNAISIKISEHDMKAYEDAATTHTRIQQTQGSMNDFVEVNQMKLGADCVVKKPLDILIKRVSRVCRGTYGTFQAASIKDNKGKSNTLFVYGASVGKLKNFNIYTVTKLKRLNQEDPETGFFKLQTTGFTQVIA